MTDKPIIIAGPCAVESQEQVRASAEKLQVRGLSMMRTCLWKPRTRPGFEGVGKKGIPWLSELTNRGITIATEVLHPDHVSEIIDGISQSGNPEKVLLWLGSRNQNHHMQRDIAARIKSDAPYEVKLMIKNQPWGDEAHWLGIVDHILATGLPSERIILCHRGFSPFGRHNPRGFRNLPDYEMAMRVKDMLGLPMIYDPSHIGGTVPNVFEATQEAKTHQFDGFMVEVHPTPAHAATDAKQQLTWEEFDRLMSAF